MTEPKSRNVQLKPNPAAFHAGPNKPSRTSNHCIDRQDKWLFIAHNLNIIKTVLQNGLMEEEKGWRGSLCFAGTDLISWSDFLTKKQNLYNMVLEADILLLLSGSVLDIEDTNEIGSPASH